MILSLTFGWDKATAAAIVCVNLADTQLERTDNVASPAVDPETLSKKINQSAILGGNATLGGRDALSCNATLGSDALGGYDEYDDTDTLREIDPKMLKSFENIVIDGNNFLYKYKEVMSKKKAMDGFKVKDRLEYTRKLVKLITKHFPDKNLYFVFKDPENEHQANELITELAVDTVRQAHKKFFNELSKEYPKSRFVIAYGDAKYRDDYAAIWLADTLPDETILLSRDRYKDVGEMESAQLKFHTYGKHASQINKRINKPFNFINKGSVKSTLVGYTFSKKMTSGFYDRTVKNKSSASDSIYIFKL